jgi:DNA-binding NarL/FixJ family response regulator
MGAFFFSDRARRPDTAVTIELANAVPATPPPPAPARVGLVEDDAREQEAFAWAIGADPALTLALTAETRGDALRLLERQPLEVLVVDLGLPDGSGLDVIAQARRVQPQCLVMVMTIFGDDAHVLSAVEAGAAGYLLKDVSAGQAAEIRSLLAGGSPINPMVARRIL